MTDNKRDHATEVSELLSVESMLKYLSGIFTSTVNSEVDRTRGAFLVDLSRAILAFCRFQDLQRSEGSVLHIGLEIDVSGALIRSLYSDSGQDDLAMLIRERDTFRVQLQELAHLFAYARHGVAARAAATQETPSQ
ncbi:MAG: hypothetical protein A2Y61_00595 [Chloroflexi bacterium RBG_13_60_13]|nr:MAG: hypothetical protein A2Y61_00595 [Chloroflexi bacterium RBG_13_60_13]